MVYVLIGMVLLGFLPLVIILWRRRQVRRLREEGARSVAIVQQIVYARRSAVDIVHYTFTDDITGRSHRGMLTIKPGVYKPGDRIDIFFDPRNPRRNTVHGAWGSKVLVWFGIAVGLFVMFAAWKIWEIVREM